MVITFTCTFCGHEMPPGTSTIYVKNDGTVYRFCSRRCRVNTLRYRRDPRKFKWTTKYVKGGLKKRSR
ncbi:MAG: 50S ribosomal protein L24e [Nitrososphaeria archaeon]|nr:50S ribosomal protein L24e [Nitrososphaeria archaeon]NIN52097.1 50S ribosomal protein L24e [Nitrososphaeria archaeon]NIQ32559.1 50S ribosomal protein L24e [Nitrososphaeria archaeon]